MAAWFCGFVHPGVVSVHLLLSSCTVPFIPPVILNHVASGGFLLIRYCLLGGVYSSYLIRGHTGPFSTNKGADCVLLPLLFDGVHTQQPADRLEGIWMLNYSP